MTSRQSPPPQTDWFKWLGAAAIVYGGVQSYTGQSATVRSNSDRLTKVEAAVDTLQGMNVRFARLEAKLDFLVDEKHADEPRKDSAR